ncbi:hypothetical protein GCM10027443_23440 [Pontibacter brevis]
MVVCVVVVLATACSVVVALLLVLLEEQPVPTARQAVSNVAEAATFGLKLFIVLYLWLLIDAAA